MRIKVTCLIVFIACVLASATASAATTVFIRLKPYNAPYMTTETQAGGKPGWQQVEDFNFNIEQTLNIGSQSTGAGAGKVMFNPLSISIAPSSLDPNFFSLACAGTPFEQVDLMIMNGNAVVQLLHYKLVAIKTMGWMLDSTTHNLKMVYTFEYGGLQMVTPSATPAKKAFNAGWNRVRNVSDPPPHEPLP